MPEAVIVSAARTPIGRANKGSLKDFRPDDLTAFIAKAALDKVPALDPKDIDDLMMGCAQPAGEAGYNIARAVAVELGYDFLPGTTVNRYCSSSLQTTRMAFHPIKAGEGDVFISAGVETVSRFGVGAADGAPNSKNAMFDEAQARTVNQAEGDIKWHDPREDGLIPDVYIAMGQTAENVATYTGISREDQDHWGVRSQNRAEEAIKNGFFERELGRKVETFGNITHAFSSYDSKRTAQDEKPFDRGINSTQLLNDGKRWWIVTVYWDRERPNNQIPAEYLKK